jgi:hypothetical protein
MHSGLRSGFAIITCVVIPPVKTYAAVKRGIFYGKALILIALKSFGSLQKNGTDKPLSTPAFISLLKNACIAKPKLNIIAYQLAV